MAGELPTSAPSGQVTPGLINPIANRNYTDTTPAIAALHDAFKNGIVDEQTIQDAFDIKPRQDKLKNTEADEGIQASQLRQSLAPAQAALAKAKLDSDFQIVPRATINKLAHLDADTSVTPVAAKADIGALNTQIALQPGVTAAGLATQAAAEPNIPKAGDVEGKKLDYEAQMFSPDGANGGLSAGWYLPPAKGGVPGKLSPFADAIMDKLKSANRLDLLHDKAGNLRPVQEVAKDVSHLPPAMSASETQQEAGATLGVTRGLQNIDQAFDILTKDPDAVGPQLNQGNVIGRFANRAAAAVGVGVDRFDNQKRLGTTLAGGILTAIQSLKGTGQIRNSEIELMKDNQPTLDSTKAQWTDWLAQAKQLLSQARTQKLSALPEDTSEAVAPIPDAADASAKGPVINTQAEYDALAPGTAYTDSAGNKATKRK